MDAAEELQILEDILTALSDIPDISIFIELIKVRLQATTAAVSSCLTK